MMEIKTAKELESTGYRCLFECVKQKGIQPVFELMQDIQKLPDNKAILVHQAIMEDTNALTKLIEKNKKIISYFRAHQKELCRLSLLNDDVFETLQSLYSDISLLDIYLENAKKLENLKVSNIQFASLDEYSGYCDIYKDACGNIINIHKYYTDGIIIAQKEREVDRLFRYFTIPFCCTNASFLLNVVNAEDFWQCRNIQIKDFSFNGNNLPTEEEIQSYEIPKEFIKK